ncbi:tetrahydrodipicolinate N-succinyltransferase N-terminal domain-containing protein [Shewanella surugensis]|uniref:2,3,4,5-tetrahydropyridine-2,6-dicarboxylate N-succinyltransferase n=1 Tax=Shewanella surugensis TaxID=212020 RepID=A0ABT0L5P8_9GAMM|nr:tetrahydrodipicolinate N-succinyltransferase N-terminal domain-containing protein [Shewanella surugensis]MCL1123014.1 tetrahydrodipicolinate N-succinyltransferase N-terminal domain-containing protein [Shewanella surugensis]
MISTKEAFTQYVTEIQADSQYQKPVAFGLGVRRSKGDATLDVLYPLINFDVNFGTAAVLLKATGFQQASGFVSLSAQTLNEVFNQFAPFHDSLDAHANVQLFKTLVDNPEPQNDYGQTDIGVFYLFDGAQAVASAEEAYFKLQCLSQRKVQPHGLCLDGAFGQLTNVAWTNVGPMLPTDVETQRVSYLLAGKPLTVTHVDKFPYMLNYHIPTGVRVADVGRARLGAYLGEGTTVMPAGYVNFNAGTEGNAMVEGRVSAGVFVKKDSDIGGGASIMGTLSGGNNNVISIGEKCLLGANSGTGISLGFGSTIAAGLYIYAGMKVSLLDAQDKPVDLGGNSVAAGDNIVKAMALSGREKLLFIQDSQTGQVFCKPNPKTIELNSALHSN